MFIVYALIYAIITDIHKPLTNDIHVYNFIVYDT